MTYPPQPPNRTNPLVWVLAALVAVLAIAVAVFAIWLFTRDDTATSSAPTPVTVSVTASTPPPATTTTAVAPPVTVVETPTGSTPAQGGPCYESEARSFGTACACTSLVCTYMGANGGYVWVQHAENSGGTHNIGDPCDSSVDRVAQDPSGKAIMCGGDTWVDGP